MRKNKNYRLIEQVYEKYRKLIYQIAKDRLGEHHLAEDAIQETILKLIKYPKKLIEASEKSPIDERNYVSRVAHNAVNDIIERRNKDRRILKDADKADIEQVEDTYEYANPEQIVIDKDSLERAKIEIGKLDRKYRDPFMLQKSNGYTIEQIADIIGVSTSSVTKRLAKARSMLKETLGRTADNNEQ